MQETERAERAEKVLVDYLRATESSPPNVPGLESRAAPIAASVASLLSLKAGAANVVMVGDMAVVRVRMRSGKAGQRTVTAGMDAFSQVVGPALAEMPERLIRGAVEALRAAFPEAAERMQEEVDASAARTTSDPDVVRRMRDSISAIREKKVRIDRQNLIIKMSALLAEGWTHDMLVDAVNASTCKSVMGG